MKKETLKQYARAGVIVRLKEIQDELNDLYREFPDIVGHLNGGIPSVLPLERKKTVKTVAKKIHWTKTPKGRKHMSKIAKRYYAKHQHWTQTPEGRKRMAAIAAARHASSPSQHIN